MNGLKRDEKGRLVKGTAPGPGRPKGSGQSLKDFWRHMLNEMTEEEKKEFVRKIPKKVIWEMAEGKPKQDTDITSGGEPLTVNLVKFDGNADDSSQV